MKKSYKIVGLIFLMICSMLITLRIIGNKKIEHTIKLANNYLLEERYEEAVLVFEDLPVIYENKKSKEAYDVVSKIKDADELFNAGKYEEAQNLLEGIKDNDIFEVSDKVIENIEVKIDVEKLRKRLGNSIQNSRNGALVAYEDDMLYFSNVEDGGKLYRKNLKTGETVKIFDGCATDINIYGDNVFFYGPRTEIMRVAKDGSSMAEKVVDSQTGNSLYYIVEDNLYYLCYADGGFAGYEMEKINLKTGKVSLVKNYRGVGDWIINQKDDEELDMYYSYSRSIKRLSNNDSVDLINRELDMNSVCNEYVYGLYLFGVLNRELYYTAAGSSGDIIHGKNKIFKVNIDTGESKEIAQLSEDMNCSTGIIGDKYLYLVSDEGTLYSVDLKTGELKKVKVIDKLNVKPLDGTAIHNSDKLFEVNGYLAYYNSFKKLIIDKDIKVLDINANHKNDNIERKYKSISTKEEALELTEKMITICML